MIEDYRALDRDKVAELRFPRDAFQDLPVFPLAALAPRRSDGPRPRRSRTPWLDAAELQAAPRATSVGSGAQVALDEDDTKHGHAADLIVMRARGT